MKSALSATGALVTICVVGARGGAGQAEPRSRTFDPKEAKDLVVFEESLINSTTDLYEPVMFMHRAHATNLGDCTLCHHRSPQSPEDRTGVEIGSHDLVSASPAACRRCHSTALQADNLMRPGLRGALHRQCIQCHTERDSGPVGCKECHRPHVPDHSELVKLPAIPSPKEVTRECLRCHGTQGQEVLLSAHWRWHGLSRDTLGAEHQISLGKANIINNYCIDVVSNWPRCTSCHVGYGWQDASFDFGDVGAVDCLVCHDTTGTYRKSPTGAGMPAPGIDLLEVAKNVARPTRRNCGLCHFYGGGADGVKHGDLDSTMSDPPPGHDIHMGRYDMTCQDCHTTRNHRIAGGSLAIPAREGRVSCGQCHAGQPHVKNELLADHLNRHVASVACQTCHIPTFAKAQPTKLFWDWSQAGLDKPETKDKFGKPTFHRKKGAAVWDMNVRPTYEWYNGKHTRYLLGDPIGSEDLLWLNEPVGHIGDPKAKIHPFKVHRGRQIADAENKYLAVPRLYGGFWKHFDWNKAVAEGMKAVGLPYSGRYEFVETAMHWSINHEVVPRERALTCTQCHAREAVRCLGCHETALPGDRKALEELYQTMLAADRRDVNLDYEELGYRGDPVITGGRFSRLPPRPARPGPDDRDLRKRD